MPRAARAEPGCRECSKRRIKCDLASPQCAKCLKKGIECSGQTRFRFNVGIANRGHLKGFEYPAQHRPAKPLTLQWDVEDHAQPTDANSEDGLIINPLAILDVLPAGVSFLLSHFSALISPHMVMFDNNNGWRDLVLPLAVNNDLIQRAVCVTAAQHVMLHRPDPDHRVELQRIKVLGELVQSSESCQVTAWIAILVLLVGETVTGGRDFRLLYRALQSFCAAYTDDVGLNTRLQAFLRHETQLFTTFALPTMDDASHGLSRFEERFQWIAGELPENEAETRNFDVITSATRVAHDLYSASLTSAMGSGADVPELHKICCQLPSGAQGEHALVWAYFVGAAASRTPAHRDFFVARLNAVYARAAFGNIAASLRALQQLWSEPHKPWAPRLPDICPVLIM